MLIRNEKDLENLFLRHRDEHQRKRNCRRVRAHMLKLPRGTVFLATRHGIIADGPDGSRRLISWKGNLLIFEGAGFRRIKQGNSIRKKARRHSGNSREVVGKMKPTSRARVMITVDQSHCQIIPQSRNGTLNNSETKFGSQTVCRYRRRPDDYEAGNLALRMWD